MSRAVAIALAIVVLFPRAALAWDPFAREGDPATPPPPVVVPADLYVVTDVYAGDVVTTAGRTTVYSTVTVRQTPGTYARTIDVVATGQASRFDGSSFNGRARLADGRLVAGTYYEDFVLTPAGFVSVNIVFFQDDAATSPPPVIAATPAPSPSPRAASPSAPPRPTPAPSTPAPPAPQPTVRPTIATAGIALDRAGPTLGTIDVLRGRPVSLWPRAFVDGIPVAVRSWRLASSGDAGSVFPAAGGGGEPCTATWLVPSPVGGVRTLSLEVTTDAVPGRVLIAAIRVTVRSPALVR